MSSQSKGRGVGKASPIPKYWCFNVHGCSTNEVKKGEIGKMFLRRRLNVCSLSDTKLKGRGRELRLCLVRWRLKGRVSGVVGGRAREGVAILLSEWLLRCVVEWKVSSRLMWVRVKIVFMSAYGPGGENSEEEKEEFWSELIECVGSFDRNESVVVLRDLNARV